VWALGHREKISVNRSEYASKRGVQGAIVLPFKSSILDVCLSRLEVGLSLCNVSSCYFGVRSMDLRLFNMRFYLFEVGCCLFAMGLRLVPGNSAEHMPSIASESDGASHGPKKLVVAFLGCGS
jgi:hypothetical protein